VREQGARTLAKMNVFDWVVTVALGSTLATILVNQNVSLVQGALALALLIGMQFIVTWSGVRAKWVRRVVSGEPSLLLYDGCFLPAALKRERVNEDDVYAAVRASDITSLKQVRAVVLETDGSFSVLKNNGEPTEPSTLKGMGQAGDIE